VAVSTAQCHLGETDLVGENSVAVMFYHLGKPPIGCHSNPVYVAQATEQSCADATPVGIFDRL